VRESVGYRRGCADGSGRARLLGWLQSQGDPIPDISEAYEIVVEKRDGQDHVTVRCEPRPEIAQAQWAAVGDQVVREVSSALEVKVAVDLRPYGTVSREFKAKRIHDLR
jgi:phenylacetate-CoA ligase